MKTQSNADYTKPARNGGKAKKAPYETCLVRCPLPVKAAVMELINKWHKKNFINQFEKDNAEIGINLINEFGIKINWNSPRAEQLKKFRLWLENKAQTKLNK